MSTTLPRPRRRKARPLVLGPHCNGLRMTPAEFDAVQRFNPNYRYELIDGVLIVNPIPSAGERGPNEELGFLLRLYQDADPNGKLLDDTLMEEYVVTHRSRRRAGRVIWIGLGRQPILKQDIPSIVAEFVSKRRRDWLRDYVLKRDEYLALGVREYWIIDRFRRTLTVYRRTDAGMEEIVVAEGENYACPLLPGFELPLGRILAIADRWAKQ